MKAPLLPPPHQRRSRVWLILLMAVPLALVWIFLRRPWTTTTEPSPPPHRAVAVGVPQFINDDDAEPAAPPVQPPGDIIEAGPVSGLLDEVAALLAINAGPWTDDKQAQLAKLEAKVLARGEAAAAPLIARLSAGQDTAAARSVLFHILRRVPGPQAEAHLIKEATQGGHDDLRTMAIESLAQRKTTAALQALRDIAQSDPDLPVNPLVVSDRQQDPSSTELPDEVRVTRRMQALAALAATRDPQATTVIANITRTGPDESIRMEAARHLKEFSGQPVAREALLQAARIDPSPYVRLAALHSLGDKADEGLRPLMKDIAQNDRDAGVRALAARLLERLPAGTAEP